METNAYKFWERVDRILDTRNETLVSFADGIGQKYSTIKMWRNRVVYPRTEYLFTISSYLGTSIDWLITGIETSVLSREQIAVAEDSEIRYMVNIMMKDRTTLPLVSALLRKAENLAEKQA